MSANEAPVHLSVFYLYSRQELRRRKKRTMRKKKEKIDVLFTPQLKKEKIEGRAVSIQGLYLWMRD